MSENSEKEFPSAKCLFCPNDSLKPKILNLQSFKMEKSSKCSHLRSTNQEIDKQLIGYQNNC